MMKIFNWILLLFALSSCYHATPDPEFNMDLVIPSDSMVTLMTDLHIIDGIISSSKSKKIPVGHLSSEYFEAVLRKHVLTREAFEESMRYYAFHTEELDEIYEKVITDLSKKESLYYPGQDSVKVIE